MMRIEQEQLDAFAGLTNQTGTHVELADLCRDIGLLVQPDTTNRSRSWVKLPGCQNPDGSDVILGEIVGEAEAKIVRSQSGLTAT